MATVEELRKQIIAKLEAGEATEELEGQLETAIKEERRAGERDRLSAIANRRKQLKAQAEGIASKCGEQAQAIDRFLKVKDTSVKSIRAIITKLEELEPAQAACFAEYYNYNQFWEETRHIPRNYLPAGLTCPMMAHSKYAGPEIVQWTAHYLKLALECLTQVETAEVKPMPGSPEKDEV